MKEEEILAQTARHEEQRDAAREQDDGEDDDEGPEQTQQHRWRSFASVGRRARVVASEPVTRARDLEENRRHEDHADHDVRLQQRTDVHDGEAFCGEQHKEQRGDRAGQPGISLHALLGATDDAVRRAAGFAWRAKSGHAGRVAIDP